MILDKIIYENVEMFKLNNIGVFCLDDSRFERLCKEQITSLTLTNENDSEITKQEYTKNVYAPILAFLKT